MKKLMITAISLISVLVVGLTVFAACGKKHNFSKSYSYDDSYHWHACTDKKCKEVKDKAKHTFGNWTVTKQPTATEKGSKSHSCTVCKKKVTEEIPATGKSDNAVTLKEGVMLDKMYDGTAVMFKAEQFSFMGTGAVTFKFQVKGSAEWVDKAPMEVGMYQVKVMVAESASYKACEGMFPFEIKKGDNAVTLKEGVMLDKMYDGTAVMFKAEQFSFMGDGAVTFKFQAKDSTEWVDKAPMEVGMYQVKVMVAESASYKACEGMFPFEIKKGDNAVTLKEGVMLDKTYDGTAVMFKAEQFSFMGDGAVTFKFQMKGSEEWVDEAPMAVGMYQVKVMVAESASYKACEGMFDFEITSASTM